MLEKIYNNSPIWFQELMITGYGLKTYFERYTGSYKKYREFYLRKDYSSYNKELENQISELKALLIYAKGNSKYYTRVLKNIEVENINKIEDIRKIPVLKKEDLKKYSEDFFTKSGKIPLRTSGTTGTSLKVLFRKEDIKKRIAYWDAFKENQGLKFREKTARFNGKKIVPEKDIKKGKFWRTNKIINQRIYSTHHMTKENLEKYVKNLNEYKPKAIDGYVNCIYELAKYIKENKIKLLFKPVVIFPTAETVLPSRRKLIEEVFRAPIRDFYASSEGAPFITECEKGKLHYRMDTGIIEIKNNENKGEILITSFTTYGTPLIRYDIGDTIEFSDEICSCGLKHPVVKKIEGRNSDFLYSKERGKITSTSIGYIPEDAWEYIENCQFIQNVEDKIEMKIVPKKELSTFELNKIEKLIRKFLGEKIQIDILIVDEILKEKSGKFRLIKNTLNFKEI